MTKNFAVRHFRLHPQRPKPPFFHGRLIILYAPEFAPVAKARSRLSDLHLDLIRSVPKPDYQALAAIPALPCFW
jgi:hypothetical protein